MKFVATFKTNEGIDKTFEIGENIGLDDAYRVVANNHLTTQSIEINPNMDYARKFHLGGDMSKHLAPITYLLDNKIYKRGGFINDKYFRAVSEDMGKTTTFFPTNRYEAFDEDGNPITYGGSDIFAMSDKLEISASKSVGGAILGLWSMFNSNGINPIGKKIYIYEISTKPSLDISHVRMADFEYLKEVRYDKPIHGNRIGYYEYDKNFNDNAKNFYGRLMDDDPYSEEEYDIDAWEDFEKYITTINKNNLTPYKKGGRTIAQTPAPKQDRVYGSKTNPKGSAKDKTEAKAIKFSPILLKSIKNKIDAHNSKYPTKKVNLATAKAVVRRGMGAYSKSHRPTISGGAPNSRQAWGIARLNKFLLKKAGYRVKRAYIQDDDLL